MNKIRLSGIAVLWLALLGAAAFSPVSAKDKPVRTIKVKLVADPAYAKQQEWNRRAASELLDIAEEVRELLGINLEIVGFEVWEHKPENDLYRLVSQMATRVDPDEAEVLIGFTFARCPDETEGTHTDAVTVPLRGMMIRHYPAQCPSNAFTPYVIIHEMVHLMGGVHVDDGSLMTPVFRDTIGLHLDPINRQIVQITQEIDFHRGFGSLSRPALDKLARLYAQAIEAGNREPVVFGELGAVYLALGSKTAAGTVLKAALEPDSSFTRIWLYLAQCEPTSKGSIDLLTKALGYADDPGAVYARLAQLYFEAGDTAAASLNAGLARKRGAPVDSVLWDAVGDYKGKNK